MKLILPALACLAFCSPAHAQWGCNSMITFDHGDSIYPVAITIDTTNYHHNIWQVGRPQKTVFTSAFSLPNAIVTDTISAYPPNDTSVFMLKAPLSLAGNQQFLEIQFSYWLAIDTGAKANVEISQDNGLDWINVADSLPPHFFWDSDTANLSSSTEGWVQFFLAYRCPGCTIGADSMLFRFTFISDSVQSAKDGWMIDNIGLSYWCQATASGNSLYPNPSASMLNITSTDIINKIDIINVLGQTISSNKYNTNDVELNVAYLPASVYMIIVNGTEVKKFVKY